MRTYVESADIEQGYTQTVNNAMKLFGATYPLDDNSHFHWPADDITGPFYVVTMGLAVGIFSSW